MWHDSATWAADVSSIVKCHLPAGTANKRLQIVRYIMLSNWIADNHMPLSLALVCSYRRSEVGKLSQSVLDLHFIHKVH
jgi:hypothetical protein